jgi:hypothetical protein
MVFVLVFRQKAWTQQEFLIDQSGGGGTCSEETIERLTWNLVFIFLSMLVLWCQSKMTDSGDQGLHRNSMEQTG